MKHPKIHAHQVLAVPILNANQLVIHLLVPVWKLSLVRLRIVDQNVQLIQIAQVVLLVLIRNVKIHVPVPVELMPNVEL